MANYELLARLFEYPDDGYAARCREAGLDEFAAGMEKLPTARIQELFISTFDWNPDTSLEVGWHLFGEQYARGEFLVRMRQEMRRYMVPESAELPDHLTHVLPIVARMDLLEAEKFTREFAGPAMTKLLAAVVKIESPFAALVKAVREALPVQVEAPPPRFELPVLAGRD